MPPPSLTVVLLVSAEDHQEKAKEIQETLQRDYFRLRVKDALCGNISVQIRSGQVPTDRLESKQQRTLFVVVSSETATSMKLRSTSVHAVLSVADEPSAQQAALSIAKICTLHCADIADFVQMAVQAAKQAALVQDAALKTASYTDRIAECFDNKQQITGDQVAVATANRIRGKVRDRWEPTDASKNTLALVTTDRQSGFDRQLAVVPFKGAVLNLCSQFWFDAVSDIIPNHLKATPHPSVSIARKCQPFPIEFVVRYVNLCPLIGRTFTFAPRFANSSHPCFAFCTQLVHDRFHFHIYLEELPERCAKLLWSRTARRYDQEHEAPTASLDPNHQRGRPRSSHFAERNCR